ncbi:hypothetical protein BDV30DRAFT_242587 [Aspergillus minisclerotigenes]|uniref:Protein-ribulosamine 3-kinase n=1 Tax=Aspergillus minisclerotigenes TaxID=656917 RepID=A0A5N6ISB6_9EURO|nr:hypothetical protein BDV30DRAFT_242587 [Aspergillus minisclerotigenes]
MASALLTSAQHIFWKYDNFAGYRNILVEFSTRKSFDLRTSPWHIDLDQHDSFVDGTPRRKGKGVLSEAARCRSPMQEACRLASDKCLANRKVWVPCYDLSRKNGPKRSMGEKLGGALFQAVGACSESRCEDEWPVGNFEILARRCVEAVVPRLIGALERDGRKVKPYLIHGDLWEGNTGTSLETGGIYVFDSAAFYAHNEMGTGGWRCHYNNIHDPVYTQTYLSLVPPSDPRDE